MGENPAWNNAATTATTAFFQVSQYQKNCLVVAGYTSRPFHAGWACPKRSIKSILHAKGNTGALCPKLDATTSAPTALHSEVGSAMLGQWRAPTPNRPCWACLSGAVCALADLGMDLPQKNFAPGGPRCPASAFASRSCHQDLHASNKYCSVTYRV